MIVTSVQPCFIPWQGYFEQMLLGETFIYLDDVQYTKKDWRNRNRLLSPGGIKNVFVPVSNASQGILINEALISYDQPWQNKMLNQLQNWYKKAPHFDEVMQLLSPIFEDDFNMLVELNYCVNQNILNYLGHDTEIILSSSIPREREGKNGRIIELCLAVGGDLLYDGKSAADFIDVASFEAEGVSVLFQDFQHTQYAQLYSENFEPYLSVIDLLMMEGKKSKQVILSNPNLTNPRLNERREKVSVM